MFAINEDLSIYATRGDIVYFAVSADNNGERYKFQAGDVVRIKVFGKKDCETVVLQKDFPVTAESETVEIFLTEEDTKIGGVISKHKDYWYEIELNPESNPQTIIGYDEDGAKIFRLFPEGRDLTENDPVITPEDIPIVDTELDLTSKRPVENQAVARAVAKMRSELESKNGENLFVEQISSDEFITKLSPSEATLMRSHIYKQGRTISVSLQFEITDTRQEIPLFVIPQEYRPAGIPLFVIQALAMSTDNIKSVAAHIAIDGCVMIYDFPSSECTVLQISFTYICE